MSARSKAWVCGRTVAGITGSTAPGTWKSVFFVSVVCCEVEVSASGWSLVQRSPIECGVSECDRQASITRKPWTTRGCCTVEISPIFSRIEPKPTQLSLSSRICVLFKYLLLQGAKQIVTKFNLRGTLVTLFDLTVIKYIYKPQTYFLPFCGATAQVATIPPHVWGFITRGVHVRRSPNLLFI